MVSYYELKKIVVLKIKTYLKTYTSIDFNLLVLQLQEDYGVGRVLIMKLIQPYLDTKKYKLEGGYLSVVVEPKKEQ